MLKNHSFIVFLLHRETFLVKQLFSYLKHQDSVGMFCGNQGCPTQPFDCHSPAGISSDGLPSQGWAGHPGYEHPVECL